MNEPNLLIVLTDQQSWWTLSLYGGTLVSTPHIDRIGLEGAKLNQYFTNSALCTPSRGCFFTGRYPHSNGAFSNCIPLNRDEVTFGQVLGDHGYRTGYFGKWHLDGTMRPGWIHPERTMGFQESRCMFNRGTWKKIQDLPMRDTSPTVFSYKEVGDEETYATDWLTHKAISFITHRDDSPFCCVIGYPDPHGPFTVRAPYDTLFKPENLPLWKTFDEDRVPDWAQARRDVKGFRNSRVEREKAFRTKMAGYLGQVKLIDDSVGLVLRALEEQGILDQTVVVFTTDHGEYMGEHGLYGKNELYETAYRIPFVVRWPRKIQAGTQVDRLICSVDFQTTVLSLLEVPPCGREQGRDAAPLLEGKSIDWTDEIHIHHNSHRRAGVFTEDWELAYVDDGDPILFDRKSDPHQTNNLFRSPGYSEVANFLTGRIIRHHHQFHSPASAWLKAIGESSIRSGEGHR